jgi:hypothetical protein
MRIYKIAQFGDLVEDSDVLDDMFEEEAEKKKDLEDKIKATEVSKQVDAVKGKFIQIKDEDGMELFSFPGRVPIYNVPIIGLYDIFKKNGCTVEDASPVGTAKPFKGRDLYRQWDFTYSPEISLDKYMNLHKTLEQIPEVVDGFGGTNSDEIIRVTFDGYTASPFGTWL